MNVLVNGIGNIGTTLLNLLAAYKQHLNIDNIYALKNSKVQPWQWPEINFLKNSGVIFCSNNNPEMIPVKEIINTVNYIFDTNANSVGLKNKDWYNSLTNLQGASAQGSEKGFGLSYMAGINDKELINQKFAHIVSCNTHSLSSIIHTLTNGNYTELLNTDFVVVRRSEDIGQHERLVTANVVSRHMDKEIGTHHAIDVIDLFQTKGINLNVQSSDITTPSQLMHSVRFSLKFQSMPNNINERLAKNPLLGLTQKFDSNVIFELGRRYGKMGRIYSHVIINENNLLIDKEQKTIKGWAFIPQEGSTLLSTLKAFMIQSNLENFETKFEKICTELTVKNW